jgi:hypothetical protein
MARHPSEPLTSGPKYRVAPGQCFHDGWVMHYGLDHPQAPAGQTDGAEVYWDGEPGDNLIPINAEAKAMKARVSKMKAAPMIEQGEQAA